MMTIPQVRGRKVLLACWREVGPRARVVVPGIDSYVSVEYQIDKGPFDLIDGRVEWRPRHACTTHSLPQQPAPSYQAAVTSERPCGFHLNALRAQCAAPSSPRYRCALARPAASRFPKAKTTDPSRGQNLTSTNSRSRGEPVIETSIQPVESKILRMIRDEN